MRILHSSDWHLGQHFIGKSRLAEHQAFFRWLKQQIEQHQVDALIVAGDIFDTSTPPSYARELYHQLVVDLLPTGCQLILLGGNHDSVAVLQESQNLLAKLHTSVIPGWLSDPAQHLLTLTDRSGGPAALLLALPFLRSRDLVQSQRGDSSSAKQQLLQQAIADCYQQLYQLALQRRTELGRDLPVLATGHLTTVGASCTESVRDIYIGTLDAFPASAFPPVDYLALGHIHQPQQVAGNPCWRYSGSPLPLSFDESRQQKSVVLLDLAASPLQPELLPVPCFQPMLSLKCQLDELQAMLAPVLAELEPGQQLWLELQLTGADALLSELHQLVQQQLADKPVELLKLRRARTAQQSGLQSAEVLSLTELEPAMVLQQRLEQEELTTEQQQQFQQMVAGLMQQLQEVAE